MTWATTLALFGAMILLALIPGPGVFAVVARSMSSGFRHGAATAAGIVFGDYVFIIFSVMGLVALANVMGSFFVVLKYLGAAYLIYLAITLWRSSTEVEGTEGIKEMSFASNFLAGLFTTLGNPKAIFFYVGFFPAFLDLEAISVWDIALIILIATLAVGGVMLGYAFAASKSRRLLSSARAQKNVNRTASGVMACSGVLLATKA
jgi:threonine/homoserine/homoserine lactone efflux protein